MALCEQCGSIQIGRARPGNADRLVTLFTSKRPFICHRCGWRARRAWSSADLHKLENYGVGGAEPDPSLSVLDEGPTSAGRSRGTRAQATQIAAYDFDLGAIDRATGETPQSAEQLHPPEKPYAGTKSGRRSLTKRRNSRRKEIVATVAVTALTMFIVVMIGMTGSCSAGAPQL